MIKRWTIHLEFHWSYWPKFYIRRNPQHGDRVVDGGVLGTLQRCPTCQDGFLHEPDPDLIMTSVTETDRGLKVSLRRPGVQPELLSPGPHTWQGTSCLECEADVSWCPYPPNKPSSNHESNPAMDFNAPMPSDIVEAPKLSDMNWTKPMPAWVPPAKISMQTRDDQGLIELLLREGSLVYVVGEIVWYDHAEHRVVAFERDKRVLLRRLPVG